MQGWQGKRYKNGNKMSSVHSSSTSPESDYNDIRKNSKMTKETETRCD